MNNSDNLRSILHELYADRSKHSVYQNIPAFVSGALGYNEKINERWRGDSTRWEYMQQNINFECESILDVGANTGFFTLNLAHKYPKTFCTALEGNEKHAEFIKLIAKHFKMANVRVLNQYLGYSELDALEKYDTILLYNVLHHAGVDYDKYIVSSKEAMFDYLVRFMGKLGEHCQRVVFQMGYNWGGNKQMPIVALNDDAGKIIFNSRFLKQAGWDIRAIATSYSRDGELPVTHRNLPSDVVEAANSCDVVSLSRRLAELLDPAMDSFSEFYRRPIFICTK